MPIDPYLRAAGDGTYELLVPSPSGAFHVLPYCFHTEEDAADWLASRKGRDQIRKIQKRYEKRKRVAPRYTLHQQAAMS